MSYSYSDSRCSLGSCSLGSALDRTAVDHSQIGRPQDCPGYQSFPTIRGCALILAVKACSLTRSGLRKKHAYTHASRRCQTPGIRPVSWHPALAPELALSCSFDVAPSCLVIVPFPDASFFFGNSPASKFSSEPARPEEGKMK
jgi:hypothetical protein